MSVIQAPKGTFDVLPADSARRAVLQAHAERILGAAGYRRIETPTYSFDDGGGRSLTLRPEGTAPVCRAYLEHGMHKLPQPVKFWYLSSFFRAEAPQRGRYRQFWQVGAETIGSAAPEADAELILLLAELLEAMGVHDPRLRISSLGTPNTRAAYREELTAFLRAHEEGLSPEVVSRIDLNPLRAFDAEDPRTRETMRDAPTLLARLHPEDAEHFAAVRERLDDQELAYEVDPTLVRGLDYYTRTLYEFTSDALGAQSAVGGGGRYDGLLAQLGGPPTPGSGWAAGIERILLAAPEPPVARLTVDLFVALAGEGASDSHATGFRLAAQARRAGLGAQLELAGRSLKGQLKQAGRLGARYVAIVGDEPLISLKDMESGDRRELDPQTVIPTILRASRLV